MDNLQEVEAHALSCIPVLTANTMLSILKLQQNTIINLLKKNN